jgi:hypothetical protein
MPSGASGRSSAGHTVEDRSLEADDLRTSECDNVASKRVPPAPLLAALVDDQPWQAAIETFRTRHPRREARLEAYETLIESGRHREIAAEVLACSYRPSPPRDAWVNKADGRKKRVFQYGTDDELLFRVLNRLLQPAALRAASPWCRSFLPGGGARAAFGAVLADPEVASKAALRLDVRDFFNSIDVDDLLATLPDEFAADAPTRALLDATLRDHRVQRGDDIVEGGRKGVMAGTPIAPVLATLYLRDLDTEVAAHGVTYARYSDDIIVLAEPTTLATADALLRQRLRERGLEVIERKSSIGTAGEPWEFLGFRCERGRITLAAITEHKLKTRTTRLARGLLRWREQTGASPERTLRAYFRRLNRRLYTRSSERGEFSWATWFLPMLDGAEMLKPLDHHIQREARYAATGKRSERTRALVPYAALVDAGHVPLVSAYWARRSDVCGHDVRERLARVVVEPGRLEHHVLHEHE